MVIGTCILDFLSSNHDMVSATKLVPTVKAVRPCTGTLSVIFVFKKKE